MAASSRSIDFWKEAFVSKGDSLVKIQDCP